MRTKHGEPKNRTNRTIPMRTVCLSRAQFCFRAINLLDDNLIYKLRRAKAVKYMRPGRGRCVEVEPVPQNRTPRLFSGLTLFELTPPSQTSTRRNDTLSFSRCVHCTRVILYVDRNINHFGEIYMENAFWCAHTRNAACSSELKRIDTLVLCSINVAYECARTPRAWMRHCDNWIYVQLLVNSGRVPCVQTGYIITMCDIRFQYVYDGNMRWELCTYKTRYTMVLNVCMNSSYYCEHWITKCILKYEPWGVIYRIVCTIYLRRVLKNRFKISHISPAQRANFFLSIDPNDIFGFVTHKSRVSNASARVFEAKRIYSLLVTT